MAYLETFLHDVTERLSAAGLTVEPEYPQNARPVPAKGLFVTAAVSAVRHEPPLAFSGGSAVPVQLTLRLRFHCGTDRDAAQLSVCWELTVLPVLLGMGLAVQSAAFGETVYDRTLDRFVREAQVQIAGAVTRTPLPDSQTEVTA